MTKNITYIVGDVREPTGKGYKFICQCVNNKGMMGSGVALAILKKWKNVKDRYVDWFKNGHTVVLSNKDGTLPDGTPNLGNIQFVRVEPDIIVINMIGQHDIKPINNIPPIRYDAMRECLKKVYKLIEKHSYPISVHVPYLLGCDRAGGDWAIVEKMIIEELCDKGIDVTAYDIDNKRETEDLLT